MSPARCGAYVCTNFPSYRSFVPSLSSALSPFVLLFSQLWPDLTVKEHLELYAAVKGVPRGRVDEEVKRALVEVGLTEKLLVLSKNLSGGQKRKLSVCIALIGGSKVVFLDEPTSGMDPFSRRSTWQILQNAREGRVVVVSSGVYI
jgi:ATP-binding cassette, subfamily A (ABC1), member 3